MTGRPRSQTTGTRSRSGARSGQRRAAGRRGLTALRLGGLRVALPALGASTLFVSVVWGMASGWLPRSLDEARDGLLRATGNAGFAVEEVLVAGRDHTDGETILSAIGVSRGDPILGFDPDAAYERVMQLPWIRSASVERRLPGTILVRIEERVPMALWQNERRHHVIDREGNVLADRDLQEFAHLPMVVGSDANERARSFLDVLSQYPAIADITEAAIRVGERRWDLRLENGIEIRLPETGLADALDELSRMAAEVELFERDVVAIDMRLDDRLIVRTSPIAAERRGLPEENT